MYVSNSDILLLETFETFPSARENAIDIVVLSDSRRERVEMALLEGLSAFSLTLLCFSSETT